MTKLRKLWHSPTLRSAFVYGASGLGFAGANLILARVLPTEEYALFTLAIALILTLRHLKVPAPIPATAR